MSTALIAGATGYLGRYAVKAFKQAGYRVRALVRSEAKLTAPGAGLAPAVREEVDEVFIGDVTEPLTLAGICDGVDVVFSAVSLMGQTGGLTWHDVDYVGNKHILNRALAAPPRRFIYVSVFNAHTLMHVPMVKAHEDFAADLSASGLPYTIIRPTGYFSDLKAFLDMAQSGRCYLLGNGRQRINPLHGADLSEACVAAAVGDAHAIDVGGPTVYTWDEIAELAFAAAGKPARITHVPIPLAKAGVNGMRLFRPQTAQLWDFFVSSAAVENVAPQTGHYQLDAYYQALVDRQAAA